MVTTQTATRRVSTESLRDWVDCLFAVIDSKDAAAFADYFVGHGHFVYGSAGPIRGRQAIGDFAASFFDMLESLHHTVFDVWMVSDRIFVELEVTYVLRDGRVYTLPEFDLLKMEGQRVRSYLVYIDPTPMLGEF